MLWRHYNHNLKLLVVCLENHCTNLRHLKVYNTRKIIKIFYTRTSSMDYYIE